METQVRYKQFGKNKFIVSDTLTPSLRLITREDLNNYLKFLKRQGYKIELLDETKAPLRKSA